MYRDFFNLVQFNYFFPKTSIYKTLSSGNLELIKSDSLKESITDIYESNFSRLIRKVDTRRNAARVLFPYDQKHFRARLLDDVNSPKFSFTGNGIAIPNNFDEVMSDPEFQTLIMEALAGRYNFDAGFKYTIENVEKCLRQIDEYLNKR